MFRQKVDTATPQFVVILITSGANAMGKCVATCGAITRHVRKILILLIKSILCFVAGVVGVISFSFCSCSCSPCSSSAEAKVTDTSSSCDGDGDDDGVDLVTSDVT
jgi:hypothetical protein